MKTNPTPSTVSSIPFIDFLWVYVKDAADSLKIKAGRELMGYLTRDAFCSLEKHLAERLCQVASNSLILELHISRLKGQLCGSSPEERYKEFISSFVQGSQRRSSFWKEYQVLEGMFHRITDLWIDNTILFLERLSKDKEKIEEIFSSGNEIGQVVCLEIGLSDVHNGGQSVYHLHFANQLEIYYKPKNLAVEEGFNLLLIELNGLGLSPQLSTYRVFSQDLYGWMENISHMGCQDLLAVERFFERSGMNICLLYLLDGVDAHHENIVASGEFPVLIDLETLFHPYLKNDYIMHADPEWLHSVLRVGMLPYLIMGEQGRPGVDGSGLVGKEGQLIPYKSPRWVGQNTDEMRLTYQYAQLEKSRHLTSFQGKTLSAADYVQYIASGFEKMYLLIAHHCNHLLKKGGAIERLSNLRMRFVARPTRFYAQVLHRMTDPCFMRNQQEADQEIDRLVQSFSNKAEYDFHSLLEEEKRAFQNRDIPVFYFVPTKTDLLVHRSTQEGNDESVIKDCLQMASAESVFKRIREMNFADCQKQVNSIHHAFYAAKAKPSSDSLDIAKSHPADEFPLETRIPHPSELLERAKAVAHLLINKATQASDGSLSWVSLEAFPVQDQYGFQPISDNLFSGKGGIALFLSALYAVTRDVQWRKASYSTLLHCRRMLKENVDIFISTPGIGGMAGIGGILYALGKCAYFLEDAELCEDACFLAAQIPYALIKEDAQFDVIGGCAGLMLSFLSCKDLIPHLLSVLKHCENHLIAHCEKIGDEKVGWRGNGHRPLTGFAHGNAGIVYALMQSHQVTKNEQTAAIIHQALNYERSVFSQEHQNWPKISEGRIRFPVSWCYGAPGIGLSRLEVPFYWRTESIDEEIEVALVTTLKNLFPSIDHLCCGLCGKLEFLISASRNLNRPELFQVALRAVGSLLDQTNGQQDFNLFHHLPRGVFNPGFMQGLAGIGYTLLRLMDTKLQLPQVLLLE